MAPISNDWLEPLKPEFRKPYYAKLYKTVMDEYHTKEFILRQMIFLMHLP